MSCLLHLAPNSKGGVTANSSQATAKIFQGVYFAGTVGVCLPVCNRVLGLNVYFFLISRYIKSQIKQTELC